MEIRRHVWQLTTVMEKLKDNRESQAKFVDSGSFDPINNHHQSRMR